MKEKEKNDKRGTVIIEQKECNEIGERINVLGKWDGRWREAKYKGEMRERKRWKEKYEV